MKVFLICLTTVLFSCQNINDSIQQNANYQSQDALKDTLDTNLLKQLASDTGLYNKPDYFIAMEYAFIKFGSHDSMPIETHPLIEEFLVKKLGHKPTYVNTLDEALEAENKQMTKE